MKTTLVIYGVLITGLLIWIFIQQRAIQALNIKLSALTPPPAPAPAGDDKAGKTSGSGDWMADLQKHIKKVDIEFNT